MRQALKRILQVVLLAALVHFAITLILLNSGVLPRLINSKDSNELRLGWDFAWSVWPGLVHASGLTIRVNDSDVQLYFRLDGVRVRFDLPALARRELVTKTVAVDGLMFRMRLPRTQKELRSQVIPFLAPIPGLSMLRLPERSPDPFSEPWKINLQGVIIENLHEIWVEEYRFQGRARVNGSFFLFPSRLTRLDAAELVADQGKITFGTTEVASDIRTRLTTRIDPFSPKEGKFLRHLHATVDGNARIVGVDFLNHYLRTVQPIHLSGGTGPLEAHLKLKEGRLQPDSTLKVEAADLKANLWAQRAQGNSIIEWHVQEKVDVGRLNVRFPHFEVRHVSQDTAKIVGRELNLLALSPDLSLEDPFSHLKVEIRIPEAKITDLSYFQAYFPKGTGIRIHGGSGNISGTVFAASHGKTRDTGFLHLRTHDVHLDMNGARITGDVTLDGLLRNGDLRTGRMDVSGTQAYFTHVRAETNFPEEKPKTYRDWWGAVDVKEGLLQVSQTKSFQSLIGIRGRDARPLLGVFTKEKVPGILTGVLSFDNLQAGLQLKVDEEELRIWNANARGGSTAIKGWLTSGPSVRQGRVLVEYGPLAAGLDGSRKGVKVKLNDAYGWYASPVERAGEAPAAEPAR
jgi:hypothetical protein